MDNVIKNRIDKLDNEEVPQGYIKTEFGIFPDDWVVDKTFGDLFDFYGGLSKSREELGEEGYSYLHYGDLHRNPVTIVSQNEYLDKPKYACDINGTETYIMHDGDVAFLDASEDLEGTSRAVLVDNPENKPFIAGLHIINGKSKDDTLQKWYKQYLTTPAYIRKQFQRLAVGFKVYGLNKDTLPKIRVAFPRSIFEQSKIAEILMKWDEIIELYQQYIRKLELKRRAIIQRIFDNRNCNKIIKLGDYIEQRTQRNDYHVKNVKSVSNKKGFIDQEEQFSKIVASEDLTNYKIVKKNDIAYNPSRINVGSIAVYEDEVVGIVSPMYIVFSCKNINPKFILLLLETARGRYEIETFLSGSVRETLSFEDLCKIELPVPNLDMSKIVNCFDAIELYIEILRESCSKITSQRKALQQYLLMGIIRV
ncbi:MAG: restriction endonuclease subunit S [Eubacterium sp.]|nr:restriction endonuclease subunit S [Eubacterium sp.]